MEAYKDLDGDSGILGYEISPTAIEIQFRGGMCYLYTHQKTGQANVEHMKKLALSGEDLNAFINTHDDVKNGWVSKRRC